MRVAVLSDIHGNLPALDAVLADVERVGVDAVVVNGDIADGPMPGETMDRLGSLGERVLWVRGNTDRWLVDAFDGGLSLPGLPTNPSAEWFAWAATRLDTAHRDLLADLPLTISLDIDGLGPVLFCHGTARDDNEFLLVDSPLRLFTDAFAGVEEELVVVGHTHMPFDRLADRRRVVNAGSVGLPYGHRGASWALLGPEVVLRQTAYDTAAATAAIRAAASGFPALDDFTANVEHGSSDAEALAAFTDTVATQQKGM